MEYRNSFLVCLLFCLFVAFLAAYDIRSSYSREKRATQDRVLNNSFLVGEWIKGEFKASDYVLRDIVSEVPSAELLYPNPDPVRQRETTDFLRGKLETLSENVTGVGLVNKDCVSTHTYNTPPRSSTIGFDGSSREWCLTPKNDPSVLSFVTHAYLANTGQVVVNQIRRFPGGQDGEFNGLAGFSIELDFFSRWLTQVGVGPHGIVAIIDTQLNLLARTPALPDALGKKVNDEIAEAFISSGEASQTFSNRSPLDGENRLYGVHKVDGLPFVVVFGEAEQDWQLGWRQRVWGMSLTVLLLWSMAFALMRNYQRQILGRARLKKVNEELRNKNSELDRFTRTVSHDLKSPLISILGFSDILKQELGNHCSEDVKNSLDFIKRSSMQMKGMIDNLLAHSRIGHAATMDEGISLREVVQEAMEALKGLSASRAVAIEIASDLPLVTGDRLLLGEMMQNLLENAIKYMGEQPTPRVEVGSTEIDGLRTCYVRDNGVGIQSEYHEQVFGLFERLNNEIEGSGIGLAKVRRIVGLHGGRIWIESAGKGQGTTFWFTLPSSKKTNARVLGVEPEIT